MTIVYQNRTHLTVFTKYNKYSQTPKNIVYVILTNRFKNENTQFFAECEVCCEVE